MGKSKGNKATTTNKEQVDGTTAKQNECHPDATTNKEQVDGTLAKQNKFSPDATTNQEQVDGSSETEKCKNTKTPVFRTLSIFDLMNNPPATISEYCKPLLFVKFCGQTSDENDEVFNFLSQYV